MILKLDVRIQNVQAVGGGSINDAFKVQSSEGTFFIKSNATESYPGMLESELKGLDLLARKSSFKIPKVHGTQDLEGRSYLVLEWVEHGSPHSNFSVDFAARLAYLHGESDAYFGLEEDNYIGSLHQSNRQHSSWVEFFAAERIDPLVKAAFDLGKLKQTDVHDFERLFRKLDYLFPIEPPSLLHGDLWSGNYMVGVEGEPVLIDPAVYFGHRYMDLGMMQLFGGFDRNIFDVYAEQCSLDGNWRDGAEVANLYPLLVHVLLFGGGYVAQIRSTLARFT